MANVIKKAAKFNKKVFVLDRPNLLKGDFIDGNVNNIFSFVGLYPIATVHGMTIGELALLFNNYFNLNADLKVFKMKKYNQKKNGFELNHNFVMTSPNMPFLSTVFVYPGACLLEGTNISEGRGTTRPFEIVGAPYINSLSLLRYLKKFQFENVIFRLVKFKPTFDKYKDEVCNGVFVHILDYRKKFSAFKVYLAIIKAVIDLYPNEFKFSDPPYEYEFEKLPFDVIVGDSKVRELLLSGEKLSCIYDYCRSSLKKFINIRKEFLLYR